MFCYKCGSKANDEDRFCKQCGAVLNTDDVERRTVKLKCEECNGILEVDSDRQILSCPYCGSKKFVQESDEVTIARIDKAKTLDIMRHEKEMTELEELIRLRKVDERKEDDRKFWKYMGYYWLILIVFLIFAFTCCDPL